MKHEAITELLTQLHGALAETRTIDEKDRELLRQLSGDIQALLAQPGGTAGAASPTVVGRVQDAVALFEVSHPDITGVLVRVGKALGDMGI